MIKINELEMDYSQVKIGPFNLEFDKGSITSIVGKSGSGKSTLIKMIAGIINPSSGTIDYGDNLSVDDITYINQSGTLFNHLTIRENLELTYFKDEKYIEKVFNKINLNKNYLDLYPFELSGGEKQRVDIARALLSESKVLVLDEIFSALDSKIKEEISTLIKDIRDEFNITVLMITHDIYDAIFISDNILVIEDGKNTFYDSSKKLISCSEDVLSSIFTKRQIKILKEGVL